MKNLFRILTVVLLMATLSASAQKGKKAPLPSGTSGTPATTGTAGDLSLLGTRQADWPYIGSVLDGAYGLKVFDFAAQIGATTYQLFYRAETDPVNIIDPLLPGNWRTIDGINYYYGSFNSTDFIRCYLPTAYYPSGTRFFVRIVAIKSGAYSVSEIVTVQ